MLSSSIFLCSYVIQEEKNVTNAVSRSVPNNVEMKSESTKLPVDSIASAIVPPSSRAILHSESMGLNSEMF